MGRRRKPTRLKLLLGNPGKRRLPRNEPVPPEGAVIMPDFLKYREIELWDQYAPICMAMGTLSVADPHVLAEWCLLTAQLEEERTKMQAAARAQRRLLGSDLGIGASSRAKLGTTGKGKKKDPADEFFEVEA